MCLVDIPAQDLHTLSRHFSPCAPAHPQHRTRIHRLRDVFDSIVNPAGCGEEHAQVAVHWVVRREISHCRNKYGEYFGITVAGYPEAHPDAIVSDPEEMDKTYWKDLHYLKEKVIHSRSWELLCGALQVPRFRAICKSYVIESIHEGGIVARPKNSGPLHSSLMSSSPWCSRLACGLHC